MNLVKMTRTFPEVTNGPTEINVPEQDVAVLEKRGWIAAKLTSAKVEKKPEPVAEEVIEELASEEKPADSYKKKSKF